MRSLSNGFQRLEPRLNLAGGWGLEAMNVESAWEQGHTGDGVVVAIIDSGLAIHTDLWANVWTNPNEIVGNRIDDDGNGFVDDVFGWDFADNDSTPFDRLGHGTQIAGAVAALQNEKGGTGVAFDAEVMPLRVISSDGTASTADIADAIRYAVDNGADVINLSLGTLATRRMELAIEYASSRNVLIVAAAGNDFAGQPRHPALYSAEMDNVISVAAYDQQRVKISSSNAVGRSGAVQVDAPGKSILTTTLSNKYKTTGGSSIAAANVAGVAALAISANPYLRVAELRDALVQGTSTRIAGSDSIGAVDVYKTIRLVSASAAAAGRFHADFDADGEVGFADFLILTNNYGNSIATHASGDVDGDGMAAFSDFLWLADTYGEFVVITPASRGAASAAAADEVFAELGDGLSSEF